MCLKCKSIAERTDFLEFVRPKFSAENEDFRLNNETNGSQKFRKNLELKIENGGCYQQTVSSGELSMCWQLGIPEDLPLQVRQSIAKESFQSIQRFIRCI